MADPVTNPDGSVTITLSRPLVSIDKTFDTLTFREPTGADLEAAGDPTSPVVYTRRLGEVLAGLVSGALLTVRARDSIAIGKIVNGFLADAAPPTS